MAIKSYADETIVVELPPESDIRKELDTLMDILKTGSGCDVIIDFARVNIVGSTSLAGFLQLRKLMEELGRRLIFSNAATITKDIFKLMCFDGIFEFVDDKSHALEIVTSARSCTN